MRAELAALVSTGRRIADVVEQQRVTFLAAGVAYYAFISLIPALLLLVALASALFGEAFASAVLEVTSGFLTPSGQDVIESALASAAGRGGATVIGAVVLLWSTLKVFRGLDTAFLQVYGVEETVSFLDQLRDATAVAISVGVGMAAMVVTGTAIAALQVVPVLELLSILLLPAVLTLVFLPMYFLLPYPPVTVREALPGAAFAAVGWTALQAGFQLYAASAGQFQVYGVIGGVLLLVTWLYLAAIVVIVGAVVNVVLAAGREPGFTHEPVASPLAPAGLADRHALDGPGRPPVMSERSEGGAGDGEDGERPRGAPDVSALEAEVERLRAEFDEFEDDVERRTVDRPRLETELKTYVRKRMRRGHARGWGPYLVLLYGTVLTLGAFYWMNGIYAIAAMVILGLSTLGLYTLFVMVGVGLNALETPGKALDYVRNRGED